MSEFFMKSLTTYSRRRLFNCYVRVSSLQISSQAEKADDEEQQPVLTYDDGKKRNNILFSFQPDQRRYFMKPEVYFLLFYGVRLILESSDDEPLAADDIANQSSQSEARVDENPASIDFLCACDWS